MTDVTWARDLARTLLELPLPRRWAHTQGVAATAITLAPILGGNTSVLVAAAWLHDIGYTPALYDSGFHPLDGARYLRDVIHADPMVCRLVAHHSAALTEATRRGLVAELAREFAPPPTHLADPLTYCDMTTSPTGQPVAVGQRLTEITARYGEEHIVSRSIKESGPELTAAVHRTARRLTRCAPPPLACSAVADVFQPMNGLASASR